MSGVISQANMQRYAQNIGAREAKVGFGGGLKAGSKLSAQQRTATLNKLRDTLTAHYTPEIANTAIRNALIGKRGITDARTFDVGTAVTTRGLTGDEIRQAIVIAKEQRERLIASPAAKPAELANLLMHKLEENPLKWPTNLKPKDKTFVLGEIHRVVDEFVKVHGQSADQLLRHLAQTMVDRASELKKSAPPTQFKLAVGTMTDSLVNAVNQDSVDAAINGKVTMGNITRALAPDIRETAVQERTTRFGMVKALAAAMATTNLQVTVDGTPATHSLKDLFDAKQGIWPKLSMADRETAIRSFMKLHAESHGYPNEVTLVLDHHKDALERIGYGEFSLGALEGRTMDLVLNLRPITAQSDDPTQLLTTLAHELTHAYEFTLIQGTALETGGIPDQVVARLAYDVATRPFTNGDPTIRDFAQEQDFYVRDFSERAGVESEWAIHQFLADPNVAVETLVEQTKDIQNGFSGEMRRETGEAARLELTRLAENSTDPFTKAKNFTGAAAIALRMGDLENADVLLQKIDFTDVEPQDQLWLSRELTTELNEVLARPRSDHDAKLMALNHLPRFHQVELTHLPETERGPRADLFLATRTRLAARETNPDTKRAMLLNLAELHNFTLDQKLPGQTGAPRVRVLTELGKQISDLFDGKQAKTEVKQAVGILEQLQTHAKAIAADPAQVPKPQLLKTPLLTLQTAVTKLAESLD